MEVSVMEPKKFNTKTLALIGVMTAFICIMGPLSIQIPISPVPISLGTLAIYFAVYVLGMKKGIVSCLVYLLIGFVGLPVFSGFSSGPATVWNGLAFLSGQYAVYESIGSRCSSVYCRRPCENSHCDCGRRSGKEAVKTSRTHLESCFSLVIVF